MVATLFYRVISRLLRLLLPIWVKVGQSNLDELPPRGPFVLCPNHLSVLDPLLLAAFSPRPMTFMAAGYLFEIPVVGSVLRLAGVLALGGTARSRMSLARALEILEQEEPVALFPEGGVRQGVSGALERGAGFLAVRTGVPLVPVLLRGTDRVLPTGRYVPRRGEVEIIVGSPILAGEDDTSGDLVEELSVALQKMAR